MERVYGEALTTKVDDTALENTVAAILYIWELPLVYHRCQWDHRLGRYRMVGSSQIFIRLRISKPGLARS